MCFQVEKELPLKTGSQEWRVLAPIEELYADFVEPHSPVVITAALLFAPAAEEVPHFPESLAFRIANGHPRFASRLMTLSNGRRVFKSVEFHTEEHVVRHRIIREVDEEVGSGERLARFERLVGSLLERPLDENKLWELHWVEGFGGGDVSDGATAVLRVHHCVADGLALTDYVTSCLSDQVRQSEPNRKIDGAQELERDIGKGRFLREGIWLYWIACIFWTFWLAIKAFLITVSVILKDRETVLTRGRLGRHKRVAVHESAPNFVDVLKHAAKRRKATINDLLMASVAGAVRAYLNERGENCSRLKNLNCGIAFNRRALYSSKHKVDNRHAVTFMTIPISEVNLDRRFKTLKTRLDELKRGFVVPMTVFWIWVLEKVPVGLRRKLWWRFTGKISLVVSNLRGPSDQLSVDGRKLIGIWPFAPHDGQCSLVVTIMSYKGKVVVSFTSDDKRVPDPHRLLTLFNQELDALT